MGGPAEATRCAGTTRPVSPFLPIAKYASSTIVSDGDVVRRFLATNTSGVCMIALYAEYGLFVAPVCTLIPSMPQGEVSPVLDPRTWKLFCPWDGGTSLRYVGLRIAVKRASGSQIREISWACHWASAGNMLDKKQSSHLCHR